ncbi:MAG: LemA family protein [Dysgonomonas sp.]
MEYANGSVDAMFKQRYDLIPNLVATVKQYMEHESGLLEKLVNLRSQSQKQNLTDDEKIRLNNQLDKTIKAFNVTVENYPNLKASEQFTMLQASLNECEGQLAAARRTYNAAVMDYNNAVEMFPTNIFASLMHYPKKEMINTTEAERQTPNVSDLFK